MMSSSAAGPPLASSRGGLTISVVVPSFRRPDALRACLRALSAQTWAPHEVIVVLRAEDHDGAAVVAETPSARAVLIEVAGQVQALNCGMAAASGEVVAITDDDAAPRVDWIERLTARFESDHRIGAVGGRDIVLHNEVLQAIDDQAVRHVGRIQRSGRRLGNHQQRSELQDVDFLKGANMALRRTAAQPFDTRLRGDGAQVHNDLEATWSIRRRGWRVVYDPAVIVDHRPAERHDGDGRSSRSLTAECDGEHNEVYALLHHASRRAVPTLFAYRLLIGTRTSPGLLLALSGRAHSRPAREVIMLAGARIAALGTLARAARS